MSSSLRPHEQQHSRLSCPSLSAGVELVMPSNHLILCCPLLLRPSVFPSISIFFSESALHIWWPNCWSFSFSISPSNEYLGLISFRSDWFDLLQSKGLLRVHVVPCGKYMIEPQWKFLTTEAWVSFPGWQYYIMLPNISTRKVTLIHGKDNGIWSNNPTFECISKGIELRFSPRYLNTHIVC